MTDTEIINSVVQKNKITLNNEPKRYPSGIVHRVYDIAQKYVLKIEGEYAGTLNHQGEILKKLTSLGAKVPKAVDYGKIDGRTYLLMEKLEGTNIVYDWMKMATSQRESIIAQLARELQIYHSIRFDSYSIRIASGTKSFVNLQGAINRVTDFSRIDKIQLKPEYRRDVEFLEDYYDKHKNVLNEEGTAVLVHNDIHLENIFHKDDKIIGIIDFDWVCQAPKDYELWKIMEVAHEPKLTVEEKLEQLYEGYQMTEEIGFLKKYYPELFQADNLADKIRLYYLEKLIDIVSDYQTGKFSEGTMQRVQKDVNDFYKSDWLDKLLI